MLKSPIERSIADEAAEGLSSGSNVARRPRDGAGPCCHIRGCP